MSVLKWQVNSSSNFALLFIVMAYNSSANFKVIPFLIWTKGSHQSPNFSTFKCSHENLPKFSSLYSSHKSVFLQNLHISSLSWHLWHSWHLFVNFKVIPSLLWWKGSHQSPNFDTFKCSGKSLPSLSCHFSNHM